jgi:hypothetical protein
MTKSHLDDRDTWMTGKLSLLGRTLPTSRTFLPAGSKHSPFQIRCAWPPGRQEAWINCRGKNLILVERSDKNFLLLIQFGAEAAVDET